MILHVSQGAWYSCGSTVAVKGDLYVHQGSPPTRLIPVERFLDGRKVIAVARTLADKEQIVHPCVSNAEQIVWLSHWCEHASV